jgi:hypothetical protein
MDHCPVGQWQVATIQRNAFFSVNSIAKLCRSPVNRQSAFTYPGFDGTSRAVPGPRKHFLDAFSQSVSC